MKTRTYYRENKNKEQALKRIAKEDRSEQIAALKVATDYLAQENTVAYAELDELRKAVRGYFNEPHEVAALRSIARGDSPIAVYAQTLLKVLEDK